MFKQLYGDMHPLLFFMCFNEIFFFFSLDTTYFVIPLVALKVYFSQYIFYYSEALLLLFC